MAEETKKSDTVTIKKDDLWKYSTFVLLGILVIGALVVFTNANGATTGAAVGAKDTQATPVDLSTILSNTELFPSLGPDNAKNTVVEFADFQCPYCALASGFPSWATDYQTQYGDLIGVGKNLEEMAANGEIRFVYVPMSFLGQESKDAVEAAYCAGDQGKFWEMHDAIFAASDGPSENTGKYSIANLKIIAQGIEGLDTAEFNSCLDNGVHTADVQTAATEASKIASGTPTFYLNGKNIPASNAQISAALA